MTLSNHWPPRRGLLRIAALAALALSPIRPALAHGPSAVHVAGITRELAAHPEDAALWLQRATLELLAPHRAAAMPPGICFAVLEAGGQRAAQRLVRLR